MARLPLCLMSFLKQSFLNFKNPTFLKILAVFILAATIPAIGITYFSIMHSTENIVEQVTQSSIKSLSDKKNTLELKFNEFEKICYQVFNNNDLKRSNAYPDLSFSQLNHLRNFLGHLNNIRFNNDLVDSIYFYDIKNDCIFSSAKYSPSDFEDMEIIELGIQHETSIIRRQLNGHDVISYTRLLEDLSKRNNILVVININYSNIFNIGSDRTQSNFDTLIFDDNCSVVLLDSQTLPYVPAEVMYDILSTPEASGVYSINKTEYFVSKVRSDTIGWNIAYLQPYSEIVLQAQLTKKLILSSLTLVLLLSFILACVYSVYLYRPIGKLVKKVREHIPPDSAETRDAYKSIDIAVTSLFNKNMSLETQYQKVLPYFKLYSINSLLSDGIFDMDKFNDVLHLLGIRFVFPQYVNVVIDFENTSFSEKEAGLLETTLSKFKREMACIIFSVNPYRASAIINTKLDNQEIYRIMETVKSELNENGIELTMGIGTTYRNIVNIYVEHRKTLALMDSKFFEGKNIIISSKGNDEAKKYIYDKKLEENLISCIGNQDGDGAVQAFSLLIKKIVDNNSSVIYIRIVCYELIHSTMEALDGFGIDPGKISNSNLEIFENIQNSGTLKELKEYMHSIISKCISLVREYREMQHDVIVAKAIEYMKANFNNNIGVDDVASVVYLSPGHLNIIFKAATGSSIYEYITELRMETAARLLKENSIKIKDVACRVGYNNVQCFQRLFKKYYNMTALEFRRSFLLDEK